MKNVKYTNCSRTSGWQSCEKIGGCNGILTYHPETGKLECGKTFGAIYIIKHIRTYYTYNNILL